MNIINFMNFLDGKELIYTYDSNLGATKSQEVMIRSKTDLFVIIFRSQKDEFEKFSPTIHKIINSFRVNPNEW